MSKAVMRGDGKWNCAASVPAQQGFGFNRCALPATQDPDENGNPTKCHIHSEKGRERLAEKRRERDRKWRADFDAKQKARKASERRVRAGAAAIVACQKIAEGHNDPRALAAEVLAILEETDE